MSLLQEYNQMMYDNDNIRSYLVYDAKNIAEVKNVTLNVQRERVMVRGLGGVDMSIEAGRKWITGQFEAVVKELEVIDPDRVYSIRTKIEGTDSVICGIQILDVNVFGKYEVSGDLVVKYSYEASSIARKS